MCAHMAKWGSLHGCAVFTKKQVMKDLKYFAKCAAHIINLALVAAA